MWLRIDWYWEGVFVTQKVSCKAVEGMGKGGFKIYEQMVGILLQQKKSRE